VNWQLNQQLLISPSDQQQSSHAKPYLHLPSCPVCPAAFACVLAQARVAANRAYLQGLGLASSAMQQGLVAPLDPNHTAVVAAARKLAKQAATARAEKQVGDRFHG
jgi:hypothetical protein